MTRHGNRPPSGEGQHGGEPDRNLGSPPSRVRHGGSIYTSGSAGGGAGLSGRRWPGARPAPEPAADSRARSAGAARDGRASVAARDGRASGSARAGRAAVDGRPRGAADRPANPQSSTGRASNRGPTKGRPARPARGGAGKRRRVRLTSRGRRVLIIGLVAVVALVGGVAATGYFMASRLSGNVGRVSGTFDGIKEEDRPDKPAAARGSTTFLMVGSDSRSDAPTTGTKGERKGAPGQGRTDCIMLLQIAADRRSAVVISIPRDSWVDIPDRGMMKVNAAYALGGPPLLVRTVEKLTDVRVDHFAVVDFYGFKSIIDAVGGVDVIIANATTDPVQKVSFPKGKNHLNGERALMYVRQRHGLPQGDFDRVKRQQSLIRAVMAKAMTVDPVKDPVQAYRLLDAGTSAISVDKGLSDGDLRSLAFGLRNLQGGGVSFLTAPVKGTGMEGDQSVVYLDGAKAPALWVALNNGTAAEYVSQHKADILPDIPR